MPQILDFHLKQLSVYVLDQGTGGAQRILTLVKHWLMSFTSICRKLPRTGRGVGPGGSFALSELCLQSERRSRQQRLSTRTTTASMEILLPDTAVLSQHGAFITLPAESTCLLWNITGWSINQITFNLSISQVDFVLLIEIKIRCSLHFPLFTGYPFEFLV